MDLYQEFRKLEVLGKVPAGVVVVGVSGGADSVALLSLLWRLRRERSWDVVVAHVQHRLRGEESLRDQKFVEDICTKLKVKLSVTFAPVERFRSQNRKKRLGVEEAARILRYRAFSLVLSKFKSRTLFTAHTANDQAETFLLNLIRGTGVAGLCGILPARPLSDVTRSKKDEKVSLLRPLLSFSRREVLSYLESQKLEFCSDSSNENLDFKRNWVRRILLPKIEEVQPKIVERITSLADLLRMDRDLWSRVLKKVGFDILLLDGRMLDLDALFKYDLALRKMFLHEIFPHATSRQIEEKYAVIEKEKSHYNRQILPLARILR